MLVVPISLCRICGGKDLNKVFELGNLASCGVFPLVNEQEPPSAPLSLVQCASCGLVQLADNFHGDDLFRHTYGYRSGINESMVRHLKGIVARIRQNSSLQAGDIVLDIGANDGTLLSFYGDLPGVRRIGIDPTIEKFKAYYQPNIDTLADFFTAKSFQSVAPGKANVITSISMFYDLPEPNAFVADIAATLAADGFWVFEQSYLPLMVERGSFDTICHEHLEYYGMHQINVLLARHGLRAFDVFVNDVNGGSFQVWACHLSGPFQTNRASIDLLLRKEAVEGYLTSLPFDRLREDAANMREQIRNFLADAAQRGDLVHGYGASTKGNTLLQYFDITPDLLPAIADRNTDKHGARTPGTNIPIISESESRAMKPDYYLALPWHFRDAFLARETEFIARGGKFVFPLPRFEIVPAC